MTKYIWITVGMISLIIALGIKQSPKTDDIEQPTESASQSQEIQYQVSESGNIKISSPKPLEKIQNPVLVFGESIKFDLGLKIVLKNPKGEIIAEQIVGSGGLQEETEDGFFRFAELLLFENSIAGEGSLSVIGISEGGVSDSIDLEVRF